MLKRLLFTIFILSAGSTTNAIDGVECELSIFQKDNKANENVLLFADTIEFIEGMTKTGFVLAFSLDIEFQTIDSDKVSFIIHTVTARPTVNNYSKKFTSQYELPARLEKVIGKNGAEYVIQIKPLKFADIDNSYCDISHSEKNTYKVTPSANFNYHYMKNSFGEFYWTLAKGILEENYEQLNELFKFNTPGKYDIYLLPCPTYSVIWDKRFGITADPTKGTGYVIFNREINTLDPFVSAHSQILSNYGYAPSFLSEGLANYLSFAVFDMKEIVREGKNIPIRSLLKTIDYFNTDPYLIDRISASFVRYLVRQYNIDRMISLYGQADDLNLADKIEAVYAKSIESLEQEWLHYIDTLQLLQPRLAKHVELSEALFKYPQMLKYAKELVKMANSKADTLISFNMLRTAYFNIGDYYNALETQKVLLSVDSAGRNWLNMGIYNMMNGNYEQALKEFQYARSLDSNNAVTDFNTALCYLNMGDTTRAKKILTNIIVSKNPTGAIAESRITMGNILRQSKDKKDMAQANTYFTEAISLIQKSLSSQPQSTVLLTWLGMAFTGTGDTDNAYTYLTTALALETRSFYIGLLNLELGKTADLLSGHKTAKEYYSQVVASPSSAYHQTEARKLIDKPFSQNY